LVFTDETARENAIQRLLGRATTVATALGRQVTLEIAEQAFIQAFEAVLELSFEEGELTASELARAEELVKEKYAHPSWTERI